MSDGTVSLMDRLRAGLASTLSGLAAGARRLEHWSARGARPIFLGLLGIALLGVGALAIVSGGHFFGGWGGRWHHGPPPRSWVQGGPASRPHDGPDRRVEGRWDGRAVHGFEGRFEGKPEAPRPPAPPVPPGPPVGPGRS
jgi:hypothetical protein